MRTEAFWQAVAQRLDAGKPAFVALVAANTRGSPGTLGAHLMLDQNGGMEGTIGGGIMEANLVARVRQAFASGETHAHAPALERLVHRKRKGLTHQSGLICAGEQVNLNLWLDPVHHAGAVDTFCKAVADQDSQCAILEVSADGVRTRTAVNEPGTLSGQELHRDAAGWLYRESSVNPRRLVIVGGGHCGKALARLAIEVGYWVDVFDTRAEVLHGDAWPDAAHRHLLPMYDELCGHLQRPDLTTVVVMTTAVTQDIAALASVVATPLQWLGVMGSPAKIHEIRSQLRARGADSRSVDAIVGPIGLSMKSDTPPEIAVSVMAQLLQAQQPATSPVHDAAMEVGAGSIAGN